MMILWFDFDISVLFIDIIGYKYVVFLLFFIFFWDLEVDVSNKK